MAVNSFSGLPAIPASYGFTAGKNVIINGDYRINQRNFSSTTSTGVYMMDRWITAVGGDGTTTYSRQSFTPGTAPVAGYEGINYQRIVTTGQTNSSVASITYQPVEDVRTLAGQTVTYSFWAKANSGTPKVALNLIQNFGSGGSADVNNYISQVTLSTSWARYSVTFSMPSVSGKTIGTSSWVGVLLWVSAGSGSNTATGSLGIQTNTFEFWGHQLEAGSTATAFQTATGTLAGELAACQRYYWRLTPGNVYGTYNCFGIYVTTDQWQGQVTHPVQMRVAPTVLEYGNLATFDGVTITAAATIAIQTTQTTPLGTYLLNTGLTGRTQYRPAFLISNNNTAGYLGLSAEL